jgi:hypothetical protein
MRLVYPSTDIRPIKRTICSVEALCVEAYRRIEGVHGSYVAQSIHRSFHEHNPTFNLKYSVFWELVDVESWEPPNEA